MNLRVDEAHQRWQANDWRVAVACYCALGENVYEASHAETVGLAEPNYPGINSTWVLDSRSLCRKQHNRHCCESFRPQISWYRSGRRIRQNQQGATWGDWGYQDLFDLSWQDSWYSKGGGYPVELFYMHGWQSDRTPSILGIGSSYDCKLQSGKQSSRTQTSAPASTGWMRAFCVVIMAERSVKQMIRLACV